MTQSERFPFVQVELAGPVGLDDARYIARDPEQRVLVVRTANPPPPPRRRIRRREPRPVAPKAERVALPASTLTVIRPLSLGAEDTAREWLDRLRADPEAATGEVASAVALINAALAAQRAASLDPHLADVSAEHAHVVRIGYGTGERVADGRWERAVEIPRGERRRRAEALRPQETIAAVLAGREAVPPSVPLLLRARADSDAGRGGEAALQLHLGLEALLAELDREPLAAAAEPAGGSSAERADRHRRDVAELEARRPPAREAADRALEGVVDAELVAATAATLEICERVLRRRRALVEPSAY